MIFLARAIVALCRASASAQKTPQNTGKTLMSEQLAVRYYFANVQKTSPCRRAPHAPSGRAAATDLHKAEYPESKR